MSSIGKTPSIARAARNILYGIALGGAALSLASPAAAQDDQMRPMATPDQPGAITLNTGPLPGAENQESWHTQYGSQFTRNVTVATLRPFFPATGTATGAAVIVAPGGGFRSLSMENEGWDVARELAKRGVAAFVLKYRLNQTPASLEEFAAPAGPPPGAAPGAGRPARPAPSDMSEFLAPQLADSRAAFALVRANAEKWGIDPDRIGMIGFSAGAALTMATALTPNDPDPAFLGDIYGPLGPTEVPADAPPLFVALAADDPLFGNTGFDLIENWRAAKRPVEFHLYEQGGHGFGMYDKTTTSTQWFGDFVAWLTMHGFIERDRPAED